MPQLTDIFQGLTRQIANWVEVAAAIIIALAVIEAIVRAAPLFVRRNLPPEAKEDVRLRLGRWLAVALEFELAADILRTAIAPTWTEIGQLAAIAAIRTALNYFLQQEIDRAAVRQPASLAAREGTIGTPDEVTSPAGAVTETTTTTTTKTMGSALNGRSGESDREVRERHPAVP